MFALCEEIKARSLFATHLHDIYDIIHESEARRDMRQRMAFFCTQIADQGLNNDVRRTTNAPGRADALMSLLPAFVTVCIPI
jgi:hypothetical protein